MKAIAHSAWLVILLAGPLFGQTVNFSQRASTIFLDTLKSSDTVKVDLQVLPSDASGKPAEWRVVATEFGTADTSLYMFDPLSLTFARPDTSGKISFPLVVKRGIGGHTVILALLKRDSPVSEQVLTFEARPNLSTPQNHQSLSFIRKETRVYLDSTRSLDTVQIGLAVKTPDTSVQYKILDSRFGTADPSEYAFSPVCITLDRGDTFEKINVPVVVREGAVAGHTVILKLVEADSIIEEHVIALRNRANPIVPDAKLTLGANFDALNGIKLSSFYSDLNVFIPGEKIKTWGFEAGIYRNQYISGFEPVGDTTILFPIKGTLAGDSVKAVKHLITGKIQNLITGIGLFFSPTLTLTRRDAPISIYWNLPYLEVVQQSVSYDSTQTQLVSSDTAYVKVRDLQRQSSTALTMYNGYFGTGLTTRLLNDNFDIRIRLVTGLLNNPSKWRPFYLCKFDLTARTFGGLRLGGEVRGTNQVKSTVIAIYFGKDISFDQLRALLTGGI